MNTGKCSTVSVVGEYCRSRIRKAGGTGFCVHIIRADETQDLPAAVKARCRKGRGYEFPAAGCGLPAASALKIRYFGTWENSGYGIQLKVSAYEILKPETVKGMTAYLSGRHFRGIGPALAKAITDRFGDDTWMILKNHPDKLLSVRGISVAKLEALKRGFRETESINELSVFLSSYGCSTDRISAISRHLGPDAVEIIRANPFAVMDVPGCGFSIADSIARGLDVMLASPQRIKASLVSALRNDSAFTGSMCTHSADAERLAMQLLNTGFAKPPVSQKAYRQVFQACLDEKQISVSDGDLVFLKENEQAETRTALALARLMKHEIPVPLKQKYLQELERCCRQETGRKLSEGQMEACRTSLCSRVSIITGGPGTGKTTILKTVIETYRRVHPGGNVTLMAPTGKAARRMSESAGLPASTIHMKIRYYDREMKYSECAEIPGGLIVVDEMSMVDQYLMDRMMSCIRDDSSHLLMVGDSSQLPSVGPGDVLHELTSSGVIPVSVLTEVFRQADGAGMIVSNAQAINAGSHALACNPHFQLVGAADEQQALEAILHIYREETKIFGIENVALLTPLRHKRIVSVDHMNRLLQDIVNPEADGKPSVQIGGTVFREGDRVIQMKNTIFASNGDIGVLRHIETDEGSGEDASFEIAFENGNAVHYEREDMQNVGLAYALTVHKSQGSEYESVIIPMLSSQKCSLFKRNLLYTACTRGRQRVIIVGDPEAVNWCIDHAEAGMRLTRLGERIRKMCGRIRNENDTERM